MTKLDETDIPEILRYSGYKGSTLTEDIRERINKMIEAANQAAVERIVYKGFDICEIPEGIELVNSGVILTGESIKKALKNSDNAILFCVTLGDSFDRAVEKEMIKEPANGVLLNSCGIALIEKEADGFQKKLALKGIKTGLRFSPGYGDLPLETQKDILNILDAEKRVGVRLNSNFLMYPLKTVTAVCKVEEGYELL